MHDAVRPSEEPRGSLAIPIPFFPISHSDRTADQGSGTIAAETAVVTAKVVFVTAMATAAVPLVVGAAALGAVG